MKLIDKFRESYYLNEPNLKYKYPSRDLVLEDYLYLRINREFRIYYLYSSDQITIPQEYMIIFGNLDRTEGFFMGSCTGETELEKFIILGWKLWRHIFTEQKTPEISQEIIPGILSTGTLEFRNYMKDKFKLELEPWIIENINYKKEI